MREVFDTRAAELDTLIRRLEAHDRCLQNFLTNWAQFQSQASRAETEVRSKSSAWHCSASTDDQEDGLVESNAKSIRQECVHTAVPHLNLDTEPNVSHIANRESRISYESHGCDSKKTRMTLFSLFTPPKARKSLMSQDSLSEIIENALNQRNIPEEEKEKTRLRTKQIMAHTTGKTTPDNRVELLIESWLFQLFSACVILFNMVTIIVQTEYESATLSSHGSFKIVNMVLNAWYTFEVAVKLLGMKKRYFTCRDKHWNIMDACLVMMYIFDFFLVDHLTVENLKMAKGFRVLRLARVIRIVRIFRFMRFATEFRKMILSMVNCLATLFWSMVVLGFVTWCFGVVFTQLITQAWMDNEASSSSDSTIALRAMFKHIPFGMYYLFQSITGGLDWGVVCERLLDVDAMGAGMFICYIVFTFFGVLNIVTSVFVDSAWRATQTHKELLIDDKLREKTLYANHVKTIFHCLDVDDSGAISIDELEQVFDNGDLKEFLAALEVSTSDARLLFRLLDHDESGVISPDEFVEGCFRLKGEARSFDVNRLIFESEKQLKKTDKFMRSMQHDIQAVRFALDARPSPYSYKTFTDGGDNANHSGTGTRSRQVHFEQDLSQGSTSVQPATSEDDVFQRIVDPMPVPTPLPIVQIEEGKWMYENGDQAAF